MISARCSSLLFSHNAESLRRSRAVAPGADFGSFAATIPSRLWPLAALVEHSRDIKGKRAAVFGSLSLTEEATLLALGAAHVTVIDYQPLVVEHPNVTTVTVTAARAAACSLAAEAGLAGARAPANNTAAAGSTAGAGDAAAVPAGFSPFDFDVAVSFSRCVSCCLQCSVATVCLPSGCFNDHFREVPACARCRVITMSLLPSPPPSLAYYPPCSFDHDGLGRYGDPIAADGDLLAMDELRCAWLHEAPRSRRNLDAAAANEGDAAAANASETASVSVDASGAVVSPDEAAAARNAAAERERRELRGPRLLFLSLPVGADALVWNQHRRYGSARLPLMLEGFTPVRTVGWEESRLSAAAPAASKSYEPVWVLLPQPPAAAVCETARRALCAPLLPLPNVPAAPGAPSTAAAAAATVGSA